MDTKKMRAKTKEISKKRNVVIGSDGEAIVSVKAKTREQIFSDFDYDSSEKLNPELSEYICEKTENLPVKMGIKLKIYTFENVDKNEVEDAVRKTFEREFCKEKTKNFQNWLLVFVMTIFGLATLTTLFLSYAYFENIYLDTILEIAAWVFLWEAVDALILKRIGLRRKRLQLLKLCTCEIEVIDLSGKNKRKDK